MIMMDNNSLIRNHQIIRQDYNQDNLNEHEAKNTIKIKTRALVRNNKNCFPSDFFCDNETPSKTNNISRTIKKFPPINDVDTGNSRNNSINPNVIDKITTKSTKNLTRNGQKREFDDNLSNEKLKNSVMAPLENDHNMETPRFVLHSQTHNSNPTSDFLNKKSNGCKDHLAQCLTENSANKHPSNHINQERLKSATTIKPLPPSLNYSPRRESFSVRANNETIGLINNQIGKITGQGDCKNNTSISTNENISGTPSYTQITTSCSLKSSEKDTGNLSEQLILVDHSKESSPTCQQKSSLIKPIRSMNSSPAEKVNSADSVQIDSSKRLTNMESVNSSSNVITSLKFVEKSNPTESGCAFETPSNSQATTMKDLSPQTPLYSHNGELFTYEESITMQNQCLPEEQIQANNQIKLNNEDQDQSAHKEISSIPNNTNIPIEGFSRLAKKSIIPLHLNMAKVHRGAKISSAPNSKNSTHNDIFSTWLINNTNSNNTNITNESPTTKAIITNNPNIRQLTKSTKNPLSNSNISDISTQNIKHFNFKKPSYQRILFNDITTDIYDKTNMDIDKNMILMKFHSQNNSPINNNNKDILRFHKRCNTHIMGGYMSNEPSLDHHKLLIGSNNEHSLEFKIDNILLNQRRKNIPSVYNHEDSQKVFEEITNKGRKNNTSTNVNANANANINTNIITNSTKIVVDEILSPFCINETIPQPIYFKNNAPKIQPITPFNPIKIPVSVSTTHKDIIKAKNDSMNDNGGTPFQLYHMQSEKLLHNGTNNGNEDDDKSREYVTQSQRSYQHNANQGKHDINNMKYHTLTHDKSSTLKGLSSITKDYKTYVQGNCNLNIQNKEFDFFKNQKIKGVQMKVNPYHCNLMPKMNGNTIIQSNEKSNEQLSGINSEYISKKFNNHQKMQEYINDQHLASLSSTHKLDMNEKDINYTRSISENINISQQNRDDRLEFKHGHNGLINHNQKTMGLNVSKNEYENERVENHKDHQVMGKSKGSTLINIINKTQQQLIKENHNQDLADFSFNKDPNETNNTSKTNIKACAYERPSNTEMTPTIGQRNQTKHSTLIDQDNQNTLIVMPDMLSLPNITNETSYATKTTTPGIDQKRIRYVNKGEFPAYNIRMTNHSKSQPALFRTSDINQEMNKKLDNLENMEGKNFEDKEHSKNRVNICEDSKQFDQTCCFPNGFNTLDKQP